MPEPVDYATPAAIRKKNWARLLIWGGIFLILCGFVPEIAFDGLTIIPAICALSAMAMGLVSLIVGLIVWVGTRKAH